MERVALDEVFDRRATQPVIFYSLYSMNSRFRRRWLPKALDPALALDKLAAWQQLTGGEVVLHWAFIEGENDDSDTIQEIIDAVRSRGLRVRFNLVRYNPYSPAQGQEPTMPVLQNCFDALSDAFGDPRSRIVPRVGHDVKASCGMFMGGAPYRRHPEWLVSYAGG
jgi:23S rRNA (adenine2503-C2)-methyltransferase